MPFKHYQQQTEKRIRRLRRDLDNDNAEWIVTANTPFELQPDDKAPQKGMLLLHGLFDSPFKMRDLGKFYQQQGFLVRAILLDGHGTIPEQLDEVEYSQWLDNVTTAVYSLQKVVADVYITGFSTGGLLALHHCLTNQNIKAIVTLCPALKLHAVAALGTQILMLTKRVIERDYWNIDPLDIDPVKYTEFPMNAPYQVNSLAKKFSALNKDLPLKTPLFIAMSEDDETVSAAAAIEFFNRQRNPLSQMLLFTNKQHDDFDVRITFEKSENLTQHILDYSHIAIPTAPDNEHYGQQGNYHLPIHYHDKKDPIVYQGALNRHNIKHYNIQRLSYNPHFSKMCEQISKFLNTINP